MASTVGISTISQRPAEILQRLIRFDTTNPPGNEAECIAFIDELLTGAGIKTTILARASERPNLIARLSGRGNAPALLLYGHVDVVTQERHRRRELTSGQARRQSASSARPITLSSRIGFTPSKIGSTWASTT